MWYVYFLELSNQDTYVGYTGNLRQRFDSHNAGNVPSTAPYLPAKLKSYVAVDSRERAISLERYFKTGSGKAVAEKRFP